MNARISVAIATYNGAMHLADQLDSIYSQTVLPFEVVAIDDGSKDSTVSILEDYRNRYGLIYSVNPVNMGVNYSFNRAISSCTGDYIALSDQDDVWHSSKLANLLAEIELMPRDQPNLVTSAVTDVEENLAVVFRKNITLTPKVASDFVPDIFMQGSTQIFNVALKNLLDIPQVGVYDLHISTLALVIGNRRWISEPTMLYRHHRNNVCASWNRARWYLYFRKFCEKLFLCYRFPPDYFATYYKPCRQKWEKFIPNEKAEFFCRVDSLARSGWNALSISEWSLYKRICVTVQLLIDRKKHTR